MRTQLVKIQDAGEVGVAHPSMGFGGRLLPGMKASRQNQAHNNASEQGCRPAPTAGQQQRRRHHRPHRKNGLAGAEQPRRAHPSQPHQQGRPPPRPLGCEKHGSARQQQRHPHVAEPQHMLEPSQQKKQRQRQHQRPRRQQWTQPPVQHGKREHRGPGEQAAQQPPKPRHARHRCVGSRQHVPVAMKIERHRRHGFQRQHAREQPGQRGIVTGLVVAPQPRHGAQHEHQRQQYYPKKNGATGMYRHKNY